MLLLIFDLASAFVPEQYWGLVYVDGELLNESANITVHALDGRLISETIVPEDISYPGSFQLYIPFRDVYEVGSYGAVFDEPLIWKVNGVSTLMPVMGDDRAEPGKVNNDFDLSAIRNPELDCTLTVPNQALLGDDFSFFGIVKNIGRGDATLKTTLSLDGDKILLEGSTSSFELLRNNSLSFSYVASIGECGEHELDFVIDGVNLAGENYESLRYSLPFTVLGHDLDLRKVTYKQLDNLSKSFDFTYFIESRSEFTTGLEKIKIYKNGVLVSEKDLFLAINPLDFGVIEFPVLFDSPLLSQDELEFKIVSMEELECNFDNNKYGLYFEEIEYTNPLDDDYVPFDEKPIEDIRSPNIVNSVNVFHEGGLSDSGSDNSNSESNNNNNSKNNSALPLENDISVPLIFYFDFFVLILIIAFFFISFVLAYAVTKIIAHRNAEKFILYEQNKNKLSNSRGSVNIHKKTEPIKAKIVKKSSQLKPTKTHYKEISVGDNLTEENALTSKKYKSLSSKRTLFMDINKFKNSFKNLNLKRLIHKDDIPQDEIDKLLEKEGILNEDDNLSDISDVVNINSRNASANVSDLTNSTSPTDAVNTTNTSNAIETNNFNSLGGNNISNPSSNNKYESDTLLKEDKYDSGVVNSVVEKILAGEQISAVDEVEIPLDSTDLFIQSDVFRSSVMSNVRNNLRFPVEVLPQAKEIALELLSSDDNEEYGMVLGSLQSNPDYNPVLINLVNAAILEDSSCSAVDLTKLNLGSSISYLQLVQYIGYLKNN